MYTPATLGTAINLLWTDVTYNPEPTFESDSRKSDENLIQRIEVNFPSPRSTNQQLFRIWFKHITEASIDYLIGILHSISGMLYVRPLTTYFNKDSALHCAIIDVVCVE